MKIISYKKLNSNKYKVYLENFKEVILYDDIILKYDLLLTKNISEKELNHALKDNEILSCYYKGIKYLSNKNRCAKEVKDYLKRNNFDEDSINISINELKNKGYINDEVYLKAFINDEVNLNMSGPNKIKQKLKKFGFDSEDIDKYLNDYDNEKWDKILEHNIRKKIKANHNKGINKIKEKIIFECLKDGFKKERIIDILNDSDIPSNNDYLNKEAKRLYEKLSKKYQGYELEMNLKAKLINKGFTYEDVNNAIKDINI